MPKHTITFNLPEEQDDLNITLRASKYLCTLADMSEFLRKITKYGTHPSKEREVTPEEMAIIEEVRTYFYDCLKDNDISDECL